MKSFLVCSVLVVCWTVGAFFPEQIDEAIRSPQRTKAAASIFSSIHSIYFFIFSLFTDDVIVVVVISSLSSIEGAGGACITHSSEVWHLSFIWIPHCESQGILRAELCVLFCALYISICCVVWRVRVFARFSSANEIIATKIALYKAFPFRVRFSSVNRTQKCFQFARIIACIRSVDIAPPPSLPSTPKMTDSKISKTNLAHVHTCWAQSCPREKNREECRETRRVHNTITISIRKMHVTNRSPISIDSITVRKRGTKSRTDQQTTGMSYAVCYVPLLTAKIT